MNHSTSTRFLSFFYAFLFMHAFLSAQTLPQAAPVKDINPGSGSSNPSNFIKLANGKAAFLANNTLMVTDGSSAGTYPASFIPPNIKSINGLTLLNGKAYFPIWKDSVATLWSTSDGLTGALVDTIFKGDSRNYITSLENFASHDGILTIVVQYGINFNSLTPKIMFQSSGLPGSIKRVATVQTNNDGSGYTFNIATVFFRKNGFYTIHNLYDAGSNFKYSLFANDTIPLFSTPLYIRDTNPPVGTGLFGLGVINDDLICVFNDTLLRYNALGQRQVLATGCRASGVLAQLGNAIYFETDFTYGIWKTEGTPAGTVKLTTFNNVDTQIIGDTLFMSPPTATGFNLWKIDNTLTAFKNILSFNAPRTNLKIAAFNNKIYLYDAGGATVTLYEPDYAKGKIKIIGQANNLNNNFVVINNNLYMGAGDSVNAVAPAGIELKSLSLSPSAAIYTCLNDTLPPAFINCPGAMSFNTPITPVCAGNILPQPNVNDNCGAVFTSIGAKKGSIQISADLNNGQPTYYWCNTGLDTVTYSARDMAYNVSTCSFTIAKSAPDPCATDIIPPFFNNCPQNIVQTLAGPCQGANCGIQVQWSAPSATDNCGITSLSSNYTPGFFPVGTTTVVYNASDAANNKATCSFTVTVTNPAAPNNYCASAGNIPWTEWIAGVQFADLNNPSSKEGYGDFTAQTATVQQGQTYPLNITKGFSWAGDLSNVGQAWAVWIDFNQNKVFDATELVASGDRNTNTANIVIPASATLGKTRMRISMKTAGTPTACETFDKGEVEDYTINITAGGSAGQPDLTLANLIPQNGATGATATFTIDVKNIGMAATATGYIVEAYLSKDTILSADDLDVGAITEGVTPVGTMTAVPGSIAIPSTLSPGNYFLIAKIDKNNAVVESNKNNNTIYAPIIVSAGNGGASCRYQDSLQLVGLYKSADHDPVGWSSEWNLNKPINTWAGVVLDSNGCVKSINLGGNNLVGLLPDLIFPHLTSLILSHNAGLKGEFQKVDMPNLTSLDVSQCSLSGFIPNFNMPNLTSLNLNENYFTGPIPNFNLPNLQIFQAHMNRLNGTIPNFNLPKLQQLDLNSNPFAPPLTDLNLPNLVKLDLSSCLTTGPLPNLNCPNITFLNLSNNGLGGCIPLSYKTFCGKQVYLVPSYNLPDFNAFCSANNTGACQAAPPQSYCASKANTPWTEWIAGVQFSNINNPSGKEGYGDFTSQVAVVKQGQTYPLTLTKGFSWAGDPSNVTQAWGVWIDFNQNGVFEASELVASGDRNSATANIVIPATSTLGNTRMRISLKTAGAPTACDIFDKGEVEDYTVNIAVGASGQPDLILANLSVPANAAAGASVNYTVDIKNIGSAPTSTGYVVGSYLSKDTILSADDLDVGIINQGVTAVGTVVGVQGSIVVPSTVATGVYYLILKADRNNAIAESNKNNNTIFAPINITGAAPPPNCKSYTVANTNDICGAKNYAPYALFLTNSGQTANYHADQVTFTRNGATATLKGVFRDQNWSPVVADLSWSGGTAAVPSGSPKKGLCLSANTPTSDWFYYPTLTGTIIIGGQTLNVAKRDSALQIGTGANQQNTDVLGGSGLIALSNGVQGGLGFKLLNETTCTAPTASAAIKTILELSASRGLGVAQLHWTSNEVFNTDHFVVEKANESGVFKNIRLIAELGVKDASVHFFSEIFPENEEGTFYYRVRAEHSDGTSRVSATRRIQIEKQLALTIYPNPTDGEAFIDLSVYAGKSLALAISDLAGQVLVVEKVNVASVEPHRLDVSAFQSGMYLISVQTEGRRTAVKKLEILK